MYKCRTGTEKNTRLSLYDVNINIFKQFDAQSKQSAMLSLQSSELASTCPLTRKRVLLPQIPGEGAHSLAGEGAGGANSDEGTDTLVLQVQYNPSTSIAKKPSDRPIRRHLQQDQYLVIYHLDWLLCTRNPHPPPPPFYLAQLCPLTKMFRAYSPVINIRPLASNAPSPPENRGEGE